MTLQTIESQDLTLGKLFDDFYVVPNFQREYVWEEKQVDQLLQDVHTEFSSTAREETAEYFIGSIVVCDKQGMYELIDGQQRMTTSYLLLCAIRDHLAEIAPHDSIGALKNQISAQDIDDEGRDVFRYRVTLQYEDSCGVLEALARAEQTADEIEAATRPTRSVKNIMNAYRVIRAFLHDEFRTEKAQVKQFYAYLTKKVKLIRVKTASLAHALKVFETINDRGVGLDSMDLLKNLMFMHARQTEFDTIKDRWKRLVDILFGAREKPLRFLRYFIFANYDVERLREDQIYEWFVKNEEQAGYKQRPLAFVEQLLNAGTAYANFINGNDVRGERNRYLVNIRLLSGAARQHLILLLAGQHLPADLFTELCRQIENLFFAFLITREPTRDFERRFALWTGALRKVRTRENLDQFVATYIQPEKEALAARFELAFRELNEWTLQKYRLRYLLAKLTQHVNESAWGSNGAETDLTNFVNHQIEHILPQTPSPEIIAAFDQPDLIWQYKHRLGNLTLLEKTINASIGNDRFVDKREAYRQSNLLLTRSLAEPIAVGANTSFNRAVQGLTPFSEWSSTSIEQRQTMLGKLALRIWDMPEPTV